MNAKIKKTPGPDHPITIEPSRAQVIICVANIEIANSVRALRLREANYPPVLYIPRLDADMPLLERTAHSTYCPYKGDCSYYSIPIGGANRSMPSGLMRHPTRPWPRFKDTSPSTPIGSTPYNLSQRSPTRDYAARRQELRRRAPSIPR